MLAKLTYLTRKTQRRKCGKCKLFDILKLEIKI